VWLSLAAEQVSSKILAIFLPVTLRNWVFAFSGNLVGAVVLVATSYWYLYLEDEPVANH